MTDYEFKVIEILDAYTILINYGFGDGAEEDETIRVISVGPEVRDPETGELLGTLDAVKAELTIVTVYEKFSLCKNVNYVSKSIISTPLSQFQTTTTEIKQLNVDPNSISNKKLPNDRTIRVGDKVEIWG